MIVTLFFFCAVLMIIMLWITYHGLRSRRLSAVTRDFVSSNKNSNKKILLVGDSIMRGVGASHPNRSLPGLISQYNPRVAVHSFAQDGIGCRELLRSIQEKKYEKYDQVVIFCGGMDVIYFSSTNRIKKDLYDLFLHVKSISPRVVYVTPPNIGQAPIFPFPISLVYKHRSQKFLNIARECSAKCGIVIIDYFSAKNVNFAADRSHLNDEGYRSLFNLAKDHIIK